MSSKSQWQIAEDLGISDVTLRNWVKQAERDEGKRPDGLSTDEREELARLRRENQTLRMEREILAASRPPRRQMLTVYDICATFQVSRAWVYENAGRLGGFKLGPGPRAPLRFDPKRVGAALTPLAEPAQADAKPKHVSSADRRRRTHLHPVYDG